MRTLRYARSSNQRLAENVDFNYSLRHALEIYNSDSVCTFIPKNACSALRYSIARANGAIEGEQDFQWIHENNSTFNPTLRSLIKAKYTFTILRCPFRRLVSAFLNRIVSYRDFKDFHLSTAAISPNLENNIIEEPFGFKMLKYMDFRQWKKPRDTAADLTFMDFISLLEIPANLRCNVHWAPQTSAFVYNDYDDWFRVEDLEKATKTLKERIDFDLVNAQNLFRHGTTQFNQTITDASNLTVRELTKMKAQGTVPSHHCFYSQQAIDKVSKLYKDDLDLYISLFGPEDLLCSPSLT
jgi:hypothetical protein